MKGSGTGCDMSVYALDAYTSIRHVMIAHSLEGEAFGPAQKMHGATFVIDVAFLRPELTENDDAPLFICEMPTSTASRNRL